MLKFVEIGDIGPSVTTPYDVVMDKQYTVDEFIREMLESRADEQGYISIMTGSQRHNRVFYTYKHGKLLSKVPAEMKGEYLRHITSIGGYGRMNYILLLERDK